MTAAVLICMSMLLFQAVPDTTELPPPAPEVPDTLAPADTLQGQQPWDPEQAAAEQPHVSPMEFRLNTGFSEAMNDSLLRWEQWYNMAERRQQQRGTISYRLGSHGRNDAMIYRAIEPRHQHVTFEGIPVNDPVSGTLNSNWLPLDRMRSYEVHTQGIRYTSEYSLRRYYVNSPLTWINFEDTRRNVRRAEVILTQNIGRSGNVELSYRGNNDDGDYRRSRLDGRQASVNYTHYINENWTAQGRLLYNNMQLQESLGYQIENPEFFDFEPLSTLAVEPNGSSTYRNSLISASLYHRPDSLSPQQSRIHIYHQRNRRFFSSSVDTTRHRTLGVGIYADTHLNTGVVEFQPLIHAKYTGADEDRSMSLTLSNWTEFRGGVRLGLDPAQFVRLGGWAYADYRSDGRLGYEAGYRIDFFPFGGLNLYQSLAVGEAIPSIQQMYWESEELIGDPDISNEQIIRAEGGLTWQTGIFSSLGLKAYGSQFISPIVIEPDSGTFINIDSYQSLGGEVFAEIDTEFFETGVSATVQQYFSTSSRPENVFLDQSGIRNTNRAYFFYKNYFFDFATFAKMGAVATFSPNSFHSSTYHPGADYWDPLSLDAPIPSYYRLDLHLSARIRSFILLLTYENILDGVGQAGYFETSRYPMPPRRFRIGLRWVLRN